MTKRRGPVKPRTLTEAEFLASLGPGEPLDVLQARHPEDVAWAMAHRHDPLEGAVRIRIVPGRPPKGKEAPTVTKAIKMPPDFWGEMETQARETGLNLHAAMRQALMEWTKRHQPKAS